MWLNIALGYEALNGDISQLAFNLVALNEVRLIIVTTSEILYIAPTHVQVQECDTTFGIFHVHMRSIHAMLSECTNQHVEHN